MNAQEGDPALGDAIFGAQCATCHAKNMVADATGPALAGSQERWGDDEALYAWIRNSQKMIASGHPRALELWEEWKPTIMTSFEALTDDDIANILSYINGVADGTYPPRVAGDLPVDISEDEESSNGWLYGLLLATLVLLALLLTRIISNLNVLAAAKDGVQVERKTLIQSLTSKGVIAFLIFGKKI